MNDKKNVRRAEEGGWVLLATLVLSAFIVSVTVTYARHAVLAKKSLEVASGASVAEEASRSGLERTRERMQQGMLPGTEDEGEEDVVETPTGEIVISEREVIDQKTRRLRVKARGTGESVEEEANLKARGKVIPGHGDDDEKVTRMDCDESATLMAGLTIISGDQTFQDVELAGLILVENGAHLTLDNVVHRGAIITRAGLCEDNIPATGANRPKVSVYGDFRLLAGTELPGVAVLGPDAEVTMDSSARAEIEGMVVADEFEAPGRCTMRGMLVSKQDPVFGNKIRRPGHGRGLQDWPESVKCGAEKVKRLSFPYEDLDDATHALMDSYDVD